MALRAVRVQVAARPLLGGGARLQGVQALRSGRRVEKSDVRQREKLVRPSGSVVEAARELCRFEAEREPGSGRVALEALRAAGEQPGGGCLAVGKERGVVLGGVALVRVACPADDRVAHV